MAKAEGATRQADSLAVWYVARCRRRKQPAQFLALLFKLEPASLTHCYYFSQLATLGGWVRGCHAATYHTVVWHNKNVPKMNWHHFDFLRFSFQLLLDFILCLKGSFLVYLQKVWFDYGTSYFYRILVQFLAEILFPFNLTIVLHTLARLALLAFEALLLSFSTEPQSTD